MLARGGGAGGESGRVSVSGRNGRTGVPGGFDMEVYIAIVGRGKKETLQSFQCEMGG